MAGEILMQAIAALKGGDKPKARQLFAAAIRQNPDNELAWSWLYSLVETDEQRMHCLKQVIRINPSNLKARQSLDALEAKYSQPPGFDDLQPAQNKPAVPYVGPTVKIPDSPGAVPDLPDTQPNRPVPPQPAPMPGYVVYQPPASPGKFTPRRIVTALAMLLIFASLFATWLNHTFRTGGLFLYNKTDLIKGFETPNGLVTGCAAVLGLILLFAVNKEKTAYFWATFLAILAGISAVIYMVTMKGVLYIDGVWYGTSSPEVGVYMAIFGAILAVGALFIPARNPQLIRQ